MDRIGDNQGEIWDAQDGFFYDLLRLPDGQAKCLKVRSMVGLVPLCASTLFEPDCEKRYPKLMELLSLFKQRHPELIAHLAPTEQGSSDTEDGACPAESNTGMFGGNSNWPGPVWMPVNALIVRELLNLYGFFGDDFKVQCPTG